VTARPQDDRVEPVARPFVAYPARLIKQGQDTLIEFPDCPGCQTVAGPDEEFLGRALEALTGWLETRLEEGEVPPQPSAMIQDSATGEILMVPVSEELTQALEDRWAQGI
jgi:predicted RNase H-like HicB family nuclease